MYVQSFAGFLGIAGPPIMYVYYKATYTYVLPYFWRKYWLNSAAWTLNRDLQAVATLATVCHNLLAPVTVQKETVLIAELHDD